MTTSASSYETLLDVAKGTVQLVSDHPEAQTWYHRSRLKEMADELDSMRGAVMTDKGLSD